MIPTERVQGLRYVERRTAEPLILSGTKCELKITSDWYFLRGQEGPKVLRPNQGHLKDGGHFLPPKEKRSVVDIPGNLDYCEHDRRRDRCELCPRGGKVVPAEELRSLTRAGSLGGNLSKPFNNPLKPF